jgi:hypothetical protein
VTVLFKRAAKLNVQGKVLVGLDFDFKVDRNLNPQKNVASFTIYNLAPANRRFFQSIKGGVSCSLNAGYESDTELPLIFLGQIKEVSSTRGDDESWVTTIGLTDGADKKNVSFSLGPGALFDQAVRKVIGSMGLRATNITQDVAHGQFGDASKQFIEGFTAMGSADDELAKLLDAGGLEGSVQNGELQITKKGQAVPKAAVTLSQDTGMIGSPELGKAGEVKAKSLLNAEIHPGRLVHILGVNLDAFFRVKRAVYSGQTSGGDWYVDLEGTPVKVIK